MIAKRGTRSSTDGAAPAARRSRITTFRSAMLAFAACGLVGLGGALAAEPDDGETQPFARTLPGSADAPDPGQDEAGQDETDQNEARPFAFALPASREMTPADLPPPNVFAAPGILRGAAHFGRDWRAGRNEYRQIIE